jgi:hypothetical protein
VGQCLVRDCSAFNGRLARTNQELLSLDRETRLGAQRAWAARGTKAMAEQQRLRDLPAY